MERGSGRQSSRGWRGGVVGSKWTRGWRGGVSAVVHPYWRGGVVGSPPLLPRMERGSGLAVRVD